MDSGYKVPTDNETFHLPIKRGSLKQGSSQTNNAGQKAGNGEFEGDTVVQCFRNQIAKFKYFERHRRSKYPDGCELFFANPKSLNLLRAFPDMLIMNATYKANRYKMPFFEVMGLTSTLECFTVACAFMSGNTEDSYLWVLNQLQEMLQLVVLRPITIMTVTDMDVALLNALATVFPHTKHILCRCHIYKDVKDRCFKRIIGSDTSTAFISRCKSVFEAKTEDVYHTQLALLESEWRNQPELIDYIKQPWLNLYKKRIVSAWTDNVTHFGIHTMNINGCADSPMMPLLDYYKGGCKSLFTFLHSELESQINKIKESLKYSLGFVPNVDNIKCFNMLRGCLSHKAFEILAEEYQYVTQGVNLDSCKCDCVLQSTHGLPCRHIISKYVEEMRLIDPSMIHKFWKTLDFGEVDVAEDRKQNEESILKLFMGRFPHFSDGVRKSITEFLYETLLPQSVSTEELPLVKKRKTRTPSTKKKASQRESEEKMMMSSPESEPSPEPFPDIPKYMHPYIRSYVHVVKDNYGLFRAIAESRGLGESQYSTIKAELQSELYGKEDMYEWALDDSPVGDVLSLSHGIDPPPDGWFPFPDFGYVVATCYQCVFAVLGSYTFVPLELSPGTDLQEIDVLCIAYLPTQDHFVSIKLAANSPLPPLTKDWESYCDEAVDGLDRRFTSNFKAYQFGRNSVNVIK